MFRRRAIARQKLLQVIKRFREKGATSPDKAMTVEELGVPPKFKDVVRRPFFVRTGIFQEVNGKYYLSEERLMNVRDRLGMGETAGLGEPSEWISCEYCNSLMPPNSIKCPNCGAPRKKKA